MSVFDAGARWDEQEKEGMRILLVALLHQLGGSAVVPEVELMRVQRARLTVHVVQQEDMYILREVDG
jgi:hypothetical protein